MVEKGPAHFVLVDAGDVWAHGPGSAAAGREVFLWLFLVRPLNMDSGNLEVPELNFFTPE